MKICFLGMTKINYMPYIHWYLNRINLEEHDVHIVYWDRDGRPDKSVNEKIHTYKYYDEMEDGIPLQSKLRHFIQYRKFMISKLKEIEPDYLIVHYSTAGILVIDKLLRKYRGKFILDYRDITYERFWLYKKMVKCLVHNAAVTFTSSDGFRHVLPSEEKIYTAHNIDEGMDSERNSFRMVDRKNGQPIRIAFWGLIRGIEFNKKLIEQLSDDSRFELHYYGRAQGKMKEFMEYACNAYSNVFFHGEYYHEDRKKFALQTDLIHNMYANKGTEQYAMGNKYYDGLAFYLPQICTEGSFMGKMVEQAGIGFAFNIEREDFADQLYERYCTLNHEKFLLSCDMEWTRIKHEVEVGNKIIEGQVNRNGK